MQLNTKEKSNWMQSKTKEKIQLDAIERLKENKTKIIEKDKIVYLEDEIDELFEIYPKSFTSQGKKSLKIFAKK